MASTAWQSVNGPVDILEMKIPVLPVLEEEAPLGEAPRDVVGLELGRFDWPEACLRIENKARRVVRRELEGPAVAPIVLNFMSTPDAGTALPPLPLDPIVAGTPGDAITKCLLSIQAEDARSGSAEFVPVLRRLTVWSPLPPGNHDCDFSREAVKKKPDPLLKQTLRHELNPITREDARELEPIGIPDTIRSGMPDTVAVREIVSRSVVSRREPDVRLLGNIIRFEFPTLN